MLRGLTRSMASMMASTEFEKCRLRATSHRDTYPPSEMDIVMILSCLADNDPETRPSTAFTTIVAKLQTSKSRHEWNYILKNLVLLDRCVEEGLFLFDIAELDLDFVKNFSDKDPKNSNLFNRLQRSISIQLDAEGLDELVRKYYFYIKAKAKLYTRPNSVRVEPNEKKKYFNSLPLDEVALEIKLLNKIISFILEIAETDSKGYLKYKLCRYVYLLFLNTSMKCFASVYLGVIHILDQVFETSLEVARDCFNVYQEYLKIAEMISVFTRNHQYIKGFQGVSIGDFINAKRDSVILSNIQTYIQILEERELVKDKPVNHYQVIDIERRLSELIDIKMSLRFDPPPQQLDMGEAMNPIKKGRINPANIPIPMTESVIVGNLIEEPVTNRYSNLMMKDGNLFHISRAASVTKSRSQTTSLTPPTLVNNPSAVSNNSETFEEKKRAYFAPSFEIFINLNETDDVFSKWNNFYNEGYSAMYLNQMAWDSPIMTQSQIKRHYALPEEPIAFVEENPRSIKVGWSFEEIESPDDEVFDHYQNFYSKSFDAKKGGKFDLVAHASNFINFLTK